jgi:predicted transcriptional regulator
MIGSIGQLILKAFDEKYVNTYFHLIYGINIKIKLNKRIVDQLSNLTRDMPPNVK